MAQDAAGDARGGPGGLLRLAAILFITAACGWMVMEMEILGGRVLQPEFGSNIYVVMGSVIGVFLLCLSAGYMLGGWLSGLRASQAALGLCIAVAGAWLVVLPWLTEPLYEVLRAVEFEGKWGALVAALALFGVPTVLLGTVSPTAVRWLTHSAADSGHKAGLVLAFSTVASFAGCVVTAFYLVTLSVRLTLRVSGGGLLALGALILQHALLHRRGAGEDAG
jgi:hypothetical protein